MDAANKRTNSVFSNAKIIGNKGNNFVTPEKKKKAFYDCSEKAPCHERLPLLRIQSMQQMHMALLPASLIWDFGTAGAPPVCTGSGSGISTPVCFCWISQSTRRGVYASFMLTGGQTLPDSVQCLPECVKHIWTSTVHLCLFSAWLHMAMLSWSSTECFLGQIFYPMKLWFKTYSAVTCLAYVN